MRTSKLILPDPLTASAVEIERGLFTTTAFIQDLGLGGSPLADLYVGGYRHLGKLELENQTKSFKQRPAAISVQLAKQQGYTSGVAASTGNFARGCLLAAELLGFRVKIVVPEGTDERKISALNECGADLVVFGKNFDEAAAKARELAAADPRCVLLEPYNSLPTIYGNATCAVELIDEARGCFDEVRFPIGGGGLAAGCALAHGILAPKVTVVGVVSRAAPAMKVSWDRGQLTEVPTLGSISGGSSVGRPGALPFAILREYCDEVLAVSESEICSGMEALQRENGLISEGAGALAFASVLREGRRRPGGRIALVISGGSIVRDQFDRVIRHVQACRGSRHLDVAARD